MSFEFWKVRDWSKIRTRMFNLNDLFPSIYYNDGKVGLFNAMGRVNILSPIVFVQIGELPFFLKSQIYSLVWNTLIGRKKTLTRNKITQI